MDGLDCLPEQSLAARQLGIMELNWGNTYNRENDQWQQLRPTDRKDVKGPEAYSGDITQWFKWSKSFVRYLGR